MSAALIQNIFWSMAIKSIMNAVGLVCGWWSAWMPLKTPERNFLGSYLKYIHFLKVPVWLAASWFLQTEKKKDTKDTHIGGGIIVVHKPCWENEAWIDDRRRRRKISRFPWRWCMFMFNLGRGKECFCFSYDKTILQNFPMQCGLLLLLPIYFKCMFIYPVSDLEL